VVGGASEAFAYHARSVSPRRLFTLALVTLASLAAACTSDDPPASSPGTSPTASEPTGSPLPTVDPGAVKFEDGVFRYSFNGVSAELRWRGGDGELRVQNGSDRELGEPGLYAVTQDQREVRGEVAGTEPIPAGDEASFAISFPPNVSYDETGFVVLLFGDENWGAFAPVPASEG
jgi:hypothetical protein